MTTAVRTLTEYRSNRLALPLKNVSAASSEKMDVVEAQLYAKAFEELTLIRIEAENELGRYNAERRVEAFKHRRALFTAGETRPLLKNVRHVEALARKTKYKQSHS